MTLTLGLTTTIGATLVALTHTTSLRETELPHTRYSPITHQCLTRYRNPFSGDPPVTTHASYKQGEKKTKKDDSWPNSYEKNKTALKQKNVQRCSRAHVMCRIILCWSLITLYFYTESVVSVKHGHASEIKARLASQLLEFNYTITRSKTTADTNA